MSKVTVHTDLAADDEVTLRGMKFHALIGILEHERTVPQPLDIDLSVWTAPASPVVDYRRLYEVVRAIVAAGPIDYLETVAERIATGALAERDVRRVRVAVRKPHVALAGPLDYAEIVVVRVRAA